MKKSSSCQSSSLFETALNSWTQTILNIINDFNLPKLTIMKTLMMNDDSEPLDEGKSKSDNKSLSSNSTRKLTSKQISKRRRKKLPNDDVSNERRQALLDLILKTNSIRQAANQLGINNSTAKSIFYKYKQTG